MPRIDCGDPVGDPGFDGRITLEIGPRGDTNLFESQSSPQIGPPGHERIERLETLRNAFGLVQTIDTKPDDVGPQVE